MALSMAPEFLANRMLWIFRKRGGAGAQTMPFAQLSAHCRQTLAQCMPLEAEEIPVIGCCQEPSDWLLVTTRRVAWAQGGVRTTVDLADLVDATVSEEDAWQNGALEKLGVRHLTLRTRDGESRRFEVEPGLPLLGLWNLLKWIAGRNES